MQGLRLTELSSNGGAWKYALPIGWVVKFKHRSFGLSMKKRKELLKTSRKIIPSLRAQRKICFVTHTLNVYETVRQQT